MCETVISNGEKVSLLLPCSYTERKHLLNVRVIYSILHICIDPYSSKQGIVFPPEQLIIWPSRSVNISPVRSTLTHKHADAHSTHGDDAGDLKRSAALAAHQTIPRPQAALGTTPPRGAASV